MLYKRFKKFLKLLNYKAKQKGIVVQVKNRVFSCDVCGFVDSDYNASLNILRKVTKKSNEE